MKTKNNLNKAMVVAAIIANAVFLIAACNSARNDNDRTTAYDNNDKEKDPKDVAEEINDAVLEDRKQEKDAQFLVEAAEITLEEIQLGQLAQTKSTDPEVKRIGKMMVTDNTKSLNKLKELASKKGITIPTSLSEDGKDVYNRLNNKEEKNFNEDYCDRMVTGHKRAIDKFENASKNAEDYEIKAWAAASLPTLRAHLGHVDMCQENIKKTEASLK